MNPHFRAYLEVPVATVEIDGEALETCPELPVILGQRWKEGGELAELGISSTRTPSPA